MRLGISYIDRKQRDNLFSWVSNHLREDEVFAVRYSPKKTKYFDCLFPKELCEVSFEEVSKKSIAFLLQQPIFTPQNDSAGWATLFSNTDLEFLENTKRVYFNRPWRLGITSAESSKVLSFARQSLEMFLSTGRYPDIDKTKLSSRFFLPADVGIALWHDGELRGSQISVGYPFYLGVVHASIRASQDERFTRLTREELDRARIEVTLLSDVVIPLSRSELKKDNIDYKKGYMIRQGENIGWYLPEVFNMASFYSLDKYLHDLMVRKANVDPEINRRIEMYSFEVFDFIESKDHSGSYRLDGPIIASSSLNIPIEQTVNSAKNAAQWICCLQENDGNIPVIIPSENGRKPANDIVRSALATFALLDFSTTIGDPLLREAGLRSYKNLLKHSQSVADTISFPHYMLFLAYLGKSSIIIFDEKITREVTEKLSEGILRIPFDIFVYSHTAGFFLSKEKENFQSQLISKIISRIKTEFMQLHENDRLIDLASWAEVIPLFYSMYLYSQNRLYLEFSSLVSSLIVSFQRPDGSFPTSQKVALSYTRGTAKIFEALAGGNFFYYKEEISRVVSWLLSMQYDDENSFMLSEYSNELLRGSFRHDYENRDSWVDSSAHFLLGVSRLINKNKNGDK